MGKIKKEGLLKLVKHFEQVNEEMEDDSRAVDINILAQCQEQAVDLGNYIEATYAEEYVASMVSILEEYCECLYQLSLQDLQTAHRKITKKVRKLLFGLEQEIQYKLPQDKTEIVFLPYKASMWDSLESIWMAAQEDAGCEVYVVPIPYFDRTADGSLGEMHYEGEVYPDYVPITSWMEYDLAEHRPDMIFIHNPYDNWNRVMSVHPDFYAKNLKQYTETLVYIPYFILTEIKPNDAEAIEEMKHFCFSPGIIYADNIILQSEDMRQIYINEFRKAAKANGLPEAFTEQQYLERKFLGMGSPKLDKVRGVKKEDVTIPDEWRCLIERADGTNRKVVLYNTTVNALLRNSEQVLDKIESIMEMFKMMEDVVLFWRPHPLYLNTIKSMRPELCGRYEAIVERYQKEGWGIYDDTPDLARAIVLSDAYYGDWSSVVQLYEQTGKPILIANYES